MYRCDVIGGLGCGTAACYVLTARGPGAVCTELAWTEALCYSLAYVLPVLFLSSELARCGRTALVAFHYSFKRSPVTLTVTAACCTTFLILSLTAFVIFAARTHHCESCICLSAWRTVQLI